MHASKESLPRARTDGLVLQEVQEEIIVYDPKSDETHLLNKTAALVWKASDGKHTIAALAHMVAHATNTVPNEEIVRYSLAQLQRKGLLAATVETGSVSTMTRRQFLGKFAVAVAVVPIVHTMKAGSLNQVSSCAGAGQPCVTQRCCPGLTCAIESTILFTECMPI